MGSLPQHQHQGLDLRTGAILSTMAAAATVAGTSAAWLTYSPHAIIIIGAIVLSAAQWVTLQRVLHEPVPLSGLVSVGLAMVGAAGWCFYPSMASQAAVSASLPDTPSVYDPAAAIFAIASMSVFTGALCATTFRRKTKPISGVRLVAMSADYLDSVPLGRLAGLSSVTLLLAVAAYTPGALYHRADYADAAGPTFLLRICSVLSPAGIAMAALVCVKARGASRLPAQLLFAVTAAETFSTGSRGLALVPVLLFLSWLLVKRNDLPGGFELLLRGGVTIWVTLVCLSLPLIFRGNPAGAGLGPYMARLREDPQLLVQVNIPKILGNVFFAVPLAGVTSGLSNFPNSWFVTSVNPLPSGLTNWADIMGNLRLNGYTPTNGLGELGNYGYGYVVGYMVTLGFALAAMQLWNIRLPPVTAAVGAVMGFGVCGALTLDLLQYNLRAGTRLAWYFIAASVILHISSHIAGSTHRSAALSLALPGQETSMSSITSAATR